MPFKEGDEVQHKSGGPKMAVEGKHGYDDNSYICSWWDDKKKKFERDTFPENVLKPYQPPRGPSITHLGSD
jgi:uncharacterized protein YodC (DUF2158 family)